MMPGMTHCTTWLLKEGRLGIHREVDGLFMGERFPFSRRSNQCFLISFYVNFMKVN